MSQRPGRIVAEFPIVLDRTGSRESIVLSEAYTALQREVWLAVRRQVLIAREQEPCERT
jgi:hypothetical protein